ncbi:hypothetical protein Pelo_1375 [Pelomyxa schiedti]|nr:hypothetical protein Pelo_1375 [Pelomyxa schiedti]
MYCDGGSFLACCSGTLVVQSILRYLNGRECAAVGRTCKCMRDVVYAQCESVWGDLCASDFGLFPSSGGGGGGNVVVAYGVTPKVAASPLKCKCANDSYEFVRRCIVCIDVLSEHRLEFSQRPGVEVWKRLADSLIQNWNVEQSGAHPVLCCYLAPTVLSSLKLKFENEESAAAFHDFILQHQSLLSLDPWTLQLQDRADSSPPSRVEVCYYSKENKFRIYCTAKVKWSRVYARLSTLCISTLKPNEELCVSCGVKKPAKPSRKKPSFSQVLFSGPLASFVGVIGLTGSGKRSLVGKICQMFPYNSETCSTFLMGRDHQHLTSVYFPPSESLFLTAICDIQPSDSVQLQPLLSRLNSVVLVIDSVNPEPSIPLLRQVTDSLSTSPHIPLVVAFHRYDLSSQSMRQIVELIKTHQPAPPNNINWLVTSTSVFAPQSVHNIITWFSTWSTKFDYSDIKGTGGCSIS